MSALAKEGTDFFIIVEGGHSDDAAIFAGIDVTE